MASGGEAADYNQLNTPHLTKSSVSPHWRLKKKKQHLSAYILKHKFLYIPRRRCLKLHHISWNCRESEAQRHDWLIRLQVWLRCSRRLAFGARRGEIWRFFFLCRLEETYTYYLCWEEVACSGATSVETVANLNRAASVQGHDSPIC